MDYKNSKRNILIPIVAAISIAAGIFIGSNLLTSNRISHNIPSDFNPSANDKVSLIMSMIKQNYVDAPPLDTISEKVIPQIMAQLDPHSEYMSPKDLNRSNAQLEGKFYGIGVQFNMITDTIVILGVISKGPSEKAGIINGDRIITINDSVVAGKNINQDDIVSMLRGQKNTPVNIGIKRNGIDTLIPITVIRDEVSMKSLDAALMLNDQITGYIKLSTFAKTSHQEIMEALEMLSKEGMKRLVFDLRSNTGGFLDQAILITNEFLNKDQMIVYTEGRARKKQEQFASGSGKYKDLEVTVLIDEGSASASEIFAGALQDNDRGTIVGRRSFGKGLVQEQIPLSDGSAIRLTVARYYTPTGRSIQKPYDLGKKDEYYNDIANRIMHSEYLSKDSIKLADSLMFKTPKGKTVYGGGGIMPDIFVPADTTGNSEYLRNVAKTNTIFKFCMDYTDKHRKEIDNISTITELKAYFDARPKLLQEFINYAATKGFRPKKGELDKSGKIINTQIKAYISRNTPLDYNGFYTYILQDDTTLDEALKNMN